MARARRGTGSGIAASIRDRSAAGAANVMLSCLHRGAHLAELGKLHGAARAGRDVVLHLARLARLSSPSMSPCSSAGFLACHHGVFSSAASQAVRSIERPRASRDITVPIGTPAISAISS